jgi:hypothetical protein
MTEDEKKSSIFLPGGRLKKGVRKKILYRETEQKCSQKHLDHIAELQKMRSKTKAKTAKAMVKV